MSRRTTIFVSLVAVFASVLAACDGTQETPTTISVPGPVFKATVRPAPQPTPTPQPNKQVPDVTLLMEAAAPQDPTAAEVFIPPCAPVPYSPVDPCELNAPRISSTRGSYKPHLGNAPSSVGDFLGHEPSAYQVNHLVLRGTYLPDTVRCTTGDRFLPAEHLLPIFGYPATERSIKCYIDVRANSYVVGSGPSPLTILFLAYPYYDDDPDIEALKQDFEATFVDWFAGREHVIFLGPPADLSSEVYRLRTPWDVQRKNDGTVIVVHPSRDLWRTLRPDEYPSHLATLEMALSAFTQAIKAAHQARLAEYGGRIGADPDLPMLTTNTNQLSQYYATAGAYTPGAPDPKQPPLPCGLAVPDQATNTQLMVDCQILLDSKDALRGSGSLSWDTGAAIASWDGVTIEGAPQRITKLKLANMSLTGAIPGGLADLDALVELKLAGNTLTGCIPPALKHISTNDLSSLNLLYCSTAPTGFEALATTENGLNLRWNAMEGIAKYRVEYRGGQVLYWTVDSDAIAGTSRLVEGLDCAQWYTLRISAYGNGIAYGAEWSDPSAPITAVTTACVTPVFGASSYTFEITEDAEVGRVVGSVAATDSPGDTVSYAITGGNDAGAFAIGEATGRVTVASALDYAATPVYALTIEATDQHGSAATVSAQVSVASVCRNRTVVPNPDENTALVGECIILYGIRKELSGAATLDWSAAAPITGWQGVRVRGTPRHSNVTHLYLSGSQLSGQIPPQLGGLEHLEVLHLHHNQLTGPIPPALGDLSRLRQLTLEGNRLSGDIPSSLGRLASLTDLFLADNRLSGGIPLVLGDLGNLEYLGLSGNGLTGGIPAELGSLSNLRALYLPDNRLSGKIPVELGRLSNLKQMVLDGNALSGQIPPELGDLSSLAELFLRHNMLTGQIPSELEEPANLSLLYLEGNQLTGCIPAGLRDTERNDLHSLGLAYCSDDLPAPQTP